MECVSKPPKSSAWPTLSSESEEHAYGCAQTTEISKDSLTLKRIFKKLESNPKLYSFGTETRHWIIV